MRHIMSDSANHCDSVCLAFESRQDTSKPYRRSREHDTRGRGNEKNCMFKIPHPYTAACSCLEFPSRFCHEFHWHWVHPGLLMPGIHVSKDTCIILSPL
jgi:hypothetical protein